LPEKADNVIVEILGMPLENAAYRKHVFLKAVVSRMVDKGFCHFNALPIQPIPPYGSDRNGGQPLDAQFIAK